MKPWMVHPPTAGGMHALESKGHTPLICGLRKPLLLLVGQFSVWSTLVVGSGIAGNPGNSLYLVPFVKQYCL